MNLLGLIFGILIICACTFSLSMHKFTLSRPVEISCQNHLKATRKILNSYESEHYNAFRGKERKKERKSSQGKQTQTNAKEKEETLPHLNGECSQLNLWPLIASGREEHSDLYETAARIIRALYEKPLFQKEIKLEYALLNALLDAAKVKEKTESELEKNNQIPTLEKLLLQDKNVKRLYPLRVTYYRMLKGTKNAASPAYPPLSDYFSIENKESLICLRHASIEMLSALFNSKAALRLHREIHKNKKPLSKDRIIEICSQSGLSGIDDGFWKLIDIKSSVHRLSSKKILVEQEGDVSLRKRVFLPSA